MALFTKEIFDNPYVALGKDADICVLCRREYANAHPDEPDYKIDAVLQKKLTEQKIFKLFRNSNTPFVLCQRHIHEIDTLLQEDL